MNIGLYHDDGYSVFTKSLGSQIEQKEKKITKIFNDYGLSITVKSHQLLAVNYFGKTIHLRCFRGF